MAERTQVEYAALPKRTGAHDRPTPRQLAVLRLIAEHMRDHHRAPTHREIGEQIGTTSTNAVADMLHSLVRHGLITVDNGALSRALRITPDGMNALGHPTGTCPFCWRAP